MNAETTQAVAELAEAMSMTEDEVLERAVRLLGIHHALLWTSGYASRAKEAESPHE